MNAKLDSRNLKQQATTQILVEDIFKIPKCCQINEARTGNNLYGCAGVLFPAGPSSRHDHPLRNKFKTIISFIDSSFISSLLRKSILIVEKK